MDSALVRTVYCAHVAVPEMAAEYRHYGRLLQIWAESWSRHGWTPVLVHPDEFRRHPQHQLFYNHCYALPTANPKAYEMSCWTRWLAMELLTAERGPAIMADSDTLNYGFTPADFESHRTEPVHFLDAGDVCCALYLDAGGAEMLVREMTGYHPAHQQCSDMVFFKDWLTLLPGCRRDRVCGFRACGEYRASYPWQRYPLIHFASSPCGGRRGRERAIDQFRHPETGVQYGW